MALGKDMARLKQLPILSCLDNEALRLVAFSAQSRTLMAGRILFRRGDPAVSAVLVTDGSLAIDAEQENDLSIHFVGPGAFLDESSLLAPGVRTATASAFETATLVEVPRSVMVRVLEAYPENAVKLRRYWAARLRSRLEAVRAATRP